LGCGRAADFEDFGCVAGVDVVAARGACVAGEDGEVGSGDGEGGAAVVGVAMG
jgi:hypothetical protein